MAPIPRPEPGQGPMGSKVRGLKAISFTSALQVTFGNLHKKNLNLCISKEDENLNRGNIITLKIMP